MNLHANNSNYQNKEESYINATIINLCKILLSQSYVIMDMESLRKHTKSDQKWQKNM